MDNPEKMATLGTQNDGKNNNTINIGHHYTQTNTNNVNKNMCVDAHWMY